MRRLLLFFLILIPFDAAATINYQLQVELFPENQMLQAMAIINFDKTVTETLHFQLAQSSNIISVQQDEQPLSFNFNEGLLSLDLINREPVQIIYQGIFADTVSEVPMHNEDPSYGVSASISTKGTFLSSAAGWYPRLESEGIDYHLSVSAPEGYQAITSGKRIAHNDSTDSSRSDWHIDYPINGLTLVAGPFQIYSDTSGKIPIYAYFYEKSADFAPVYLKAAREYLQLYEELFGAYPFHKFAVVENFFPTGYGFPSWTLLGSSVIRLPFIVKTSLGHEIAHSWWGTGVRVDYRQGNWAEGLTTYVADYLYKERHSSREALEYRLKILRDYAVLVNKQSDVPISSFMSRHDRASQSIGYGKTAMMFHMLRQRVGDDIFWRTLKQIATEKMFQQIDWTDFVCYFSAASSLNLADFFNQWLQRPAGPILSLQNINVEEAAKGFLISAVLKQHSEIYQLEIPVELETENGIIVQTVAIKSKEQQFTISSENKPLKLTVDPKADLFRILDKKEIPATVNSIRGSHQLLAVTGDRLKPSDNATQTLLAALRKSGLKIRRIQDVSEKEMAANDLLIFGATDALKPQKLRGKKIELAGAKQNLAGNSLFLVQANPFNESRVAAWLLSHGNSDDSSVARKIPHYGKYSYLLFSAKDNSLKGTFAPQESPLQIRLSD